MKKREQKHLYYITLEAYDENMYGAYSFYDEFYGTNTELKRQIKSFENNGCKLICVTRA